MDISATLDDANQDSVSTDQQGDTSPSPALDINSLLGSDGPSAATTGGSDDNSGISISPITPVAPDSNNSDIIPNKTVRTNDASVVGEAKIPEEEPDQSEPPSLEPFMPEPEPTTGSESETEAQPSLAAVPEVQPSTPPLSDLSADVPSAVPEDPEKVDFVKTYTAEFDEAVKRAATAIQKILDSVDKSIHEKLPEISIPESANEFLKEPPKDGKVEKFEDVRDLVKEVMDHANESKQQSEAAATEAARIYDEVQAFKQETTQQIATLTGDNK